MSIRFTALGFEFTGPGPVVATRRAGFTALGVNFSTLGLENPGVGLVNPKPGLVTPKAGAEKKEGNLGRGSLPFAIANIGIGARNSKSAFSDLTI